MDISPESVHTEQDTLWVKLKDGRTIGAPLSWFPRLLEATSEQLAKYELTPCGIHWEALDEDINIEGLLAGRGDQTHPPGHEAA